MKTTKVTLPKALSKLSNATLLRRADALDEKARQLTERAFRHRSLAICRYNLAMCEAIMAKHSKKQMLTLEEYYFGMLSFIPGGVSDTNWKHCRAAVRAARRAGRVTGLN